MELLRNYHRCWESKPQVNMEKFAEISGFGNIQSATSKINRLLRKITEVSGGASPAKNGEAENEDASSVASVSKKKSGVRKRKGGSAEVDRTEDETPTKKKTTPNKSKAKTGAGAASSEEEVSVEKEASQGT